MEWKKLEYNDLMRQKYNLRSKPLNSEKDPPTRPAPTFPKTIFLLDHENQFSTGRPHYQTTSSVPDDDHLIF